jgi:hypothetical protein
VSFGFSGVGCLDFKPLEAKTPPSDPVRNTVSVVSKSMKALSLGACWLIGCVTNINAYNIPITDKAKTTARVHPIKTMSLACNSSGVRRFVDFLGDEVLRADSRNLASRRLTFFIGPPFVILAVISYPSLVAAS